MLTWFRQRREYLWAPALYVLVVMVLYKEVWWGINGHLRWFGWDCLEYYWPDISYYAGNIRHHDFALWNPYDRGGYAFYADTHTGLYYPVTWVFSGLGAAFGSMPAWTIQAKALVHLMIAGICMHVYVRSRGLHPAAAALAGVAWIVSVPMIVHKASALEWPLVWGPLILFAVDQAVEGARDRRRWWRVAALLAAAMWLSSSAGPPYGFFYNLVIALPYGMMRVGQELYRHRGEGKRGLKRGLLGHTMTIGVAAIGTFMLLAVMVIPAMNALKLSKRSKRQKEYPYRTALPVKPTLEAMVAPRAGKVDAYCGVLVLGLALTALAMRPKKDGFAPVFFFVGAAATISLTFGRDSPLLPFLVNHLPGFELFREPNRYKCLAAMLLAIGAAHGLDAFIRADRGERKRLLATAGAVFGLLFVAALWLKAGKPPPKGILARAPAGWWLTFTAIVLGAGLCIAVVFAKGSAKAAIAAAVVGLVYFDAASFGNWYIEKPTEKPVDDQQDRRFLAGLGNVQSEWRIYDEFVMEQRPGSRLRIRNFRGYPSGAPFGDTRYETVRAQLRFHPQLLEAFNVRWVLHGRHHRSGLHKNNIKRPPNLGRGRGHFRRLDAKRYEALHPVPIVAWYKAVKIVGGPPMKALHALRLAEEPGGIRRVAIVEPRDIPDSLQPTLQKMSQVKDAPPLVAGTILHYEPDKIKFTINAPAAGIVVLNEKMYPGWHASVDGKSVAGFRANYLLRAVVVGPGEHTIVWTFSPSRWRFYLALFFLAFGFVCTAGVFSFRDWRRCAAATPPVQADEHDAAEHGEHADEGQDDIRGGPVAHDDAVLAGADEHAAEQAVDDNDVR